MIKSNRKVVLAAVLFAGTISFGACSSASTNTVSTGNTNAASVGNTANTNRSSSPAAPGNTNAAPANTTSEAKPPVKKEDMLAADTAKTESAGDKVGVPECDEYIAKYEACLNGKVPEAQRGNLLVSMEEMRKGWRNAATNPQAKAALAGGCKTALATAKNSMSQYSCSW